MIGELPDALTVGGKPCPIRSDFRAALIIFQALDDPELDGREKAAVMISSLYERPEEIPSENIEEALERASWFLDGGDMPKTELHAKTLDWEQDEGMIFAAVNKTAGFEVRSVKYMHWWTFLGYFSESGDTLLSTVIHLRQKLSRKKKLDKWEQEFISEHRTLIMIRHKKTDEEKAEEDFVNSLFGQ